MEKTESEKLVDILYQIIWDYVEVNDEKMKLADLVLILEQIKLEMLNGVTNEEEDE